MELAEVHEQLRAGGLGRLWGPGCSGSRPGRIGGKNEVGRAPLQGLERRQGTRSSDRWRALGDSQGA